MYLFDSAFNYVDETVTAVAANTAFSLYIVHIVVKLSIPGIDTVTDYPSVVG